jgi:hypothetical protein
VRRGGRFILKPDSLYSLSEDQDLEKCMAQQPAHHVNSNKMSDACRDFRQYTG